MAIELMDVTGFNFGERAKLVAALDIIKEHWRPGVRVVTVLRAGGVGRNAAERLTRELTELGYLRLERWVDARHPRLFRGRLVPAEVTGIRAPRNPGAPKELGGQVLVLPVSPEFTSEGPRNPGAPKGLGVLPLVKEEERKRDSDSSTTKVETEILQPRTTEPKTTTSPSPPRVPLSLSSSAYDGLFATWWAAYPRKEDKIAARKAWDKARKVASVEELQAGAERYRDDPAREKRYTKMPPTWLNKGSWANEALPADEPPKTQGQAVWDAAKRMSRYWDEHKEER